VTSKKRRSLLKGLLAGATTMVVPPMMALTNSARAEGNKAAVEDAVARAIGSIYGKASIEESDAIQLDVPVFAESGRTVPVTVSTSLEDVTSISVLVKNNDPALAMTVDLESGTEPFVSSRVQVDKTSDIVAVVKSGEGLYVTSVDVIVQSQDGCFGS
jgi:sulfur-oxidizing protein SoxY